ncbi:LysR substrate-binding domain-containing protein [Pseudomonas alloputida]|uniref:LysR substrate-binding domain-containing protein n=1 Tax=Pseudomonas TaxID=286 RepID=UPI003EE8C668
MRADTPLKAVACFDAVMRTGSATLAARQLFVTPGAVGQQLRKLEAWLGIPLFIRSVRKLEPTEQALRYWEQIKPALQQIDEANAGIRSDRTWEVRISLPPALANSWFAKRIPELTSEYPALELHLNASVEPADLQAGEFDLAIRHFDGEHPDLDAFLLLGDEVRVYCSPEYRDRLNLVRHEDMPGSTLLYTTSHAYWSRWLAQIGMSFDGINRRLKFDQSELAIDAARRSQGMLLTSPWLVEEDVQQGRLIQIFPIGLRTEKDYYLIKAKGRSLGQGAQLLYDWLKSKASLA